MENTDRLSDIDASPLNIEALGLALNDRVEHERTEYEYTGERKNGFPIFAEIEGGTLDRLSGRIVAMGISADFQLVIVELEPTQLPAYEPVQLPAYGSEPPRTGDPQTQRPADPPPSRGAERYRSFAGIFRDGVPQHMITDGTPSIPRPRATGPQTNSPIRRQGRELPPGSREEPDERARGRGRGGPRR
jgi:hypothetical protein